MKTVKALLFLLLLATTILAVSAPAGAGDELEFLDHVYRSEMADFRSWRMPPGMTTQMPGEGPHGDFITTYFNDIALRAVYENAQTMPEGAILAKDNFNADHEYRSTVIMRKTDGRWFWGLLKPEGIPRSAGTGLDGDRLHTCLQCHLSAKHDNVYAWKP